MKKQVISRNNVVAGLFLVVSIALAVGIAFTLSDVQDSFADRTEYIARFPTSIGVTGLQPGADVTFGGLRVGKVVGITAHRQTDPETGIEYTVAHDVRIAVRSDLTLFEGAFADISLPVLGGVSRINFPSAGEGTWEGGPDDSNVVLDEGEVVRGRYAPSILAQLGFSTEEAEALQTTIHEVRAATENVSEVTERFRRMAAMLEPEFEQGVEDGRSTIANIRAFTENLEGEDGWSARVESLLGSADEAAGKLPPLLDEARGTIEQTRAMLDENRPRVARILENAEITSERVRFDTVGRLNELLEKGSLALASYKDVADDVDSLIATNRPKINATVTEVRDISVQGRLLLEELRAQPWRLLKKPNAEELAREPIYEAARSYARAVADLRVASEALDAAVSSAAQTGEPGAAADVSRLADLVEESYERYTETERALLERLRRNGQRR